MASSTDPTQDLLARIAGSITEKDLEDPEIAALLEQAVSLFQSDKQSPEGQPTPENQEQDSGLDPKVVDQLSQIKDKAERFKEAVKAFGAKPDTFQQLAQAMQAAGLLNQSADG